MCKKIKAHLLGGLFLLLSSCKEVHKQNRYTNVVKQEEARLVDIPLMLDFVSTSFEQQIDKELSAVFQSYTDTQEIKEFYCIEMERLGWKLLAQFEHEGYELIFEKPYKVALVTLKRAGKKSIITLLSSHKI